MAVAFRSSQSVTNGTAGTAVTVTKPAGIVDTGADPVKDQLIAVIAAVGVPSITPPAGWTLVETVASGSAVTMWTYRKLATSEGASWTWTLGASQRNWGWVGAYTGVDPTTPVYLSSTRNTLDASISIIVSDFVVPASLYIAAAAATRTASGSATTWTVVDADGGTTTERLDTSTNAGAGTDIAGVVADRLYPLNYPKVVTATATASQTQTAGVLSYILLNPYFVPYAGAVNGTGVVLEAAFGVDPDGDSSTWIWTDLTSFVHNPAALTLRHGRANRTSIADPSEMRFTLLNLAGEFTSPSGTYGTQMTRNLPFRVRLTGFGVGSALGYFRGTAFMSSLRPRWDTSSRFAVVDIVANGRLRRLQQRTEPLHSSAYTAIQRMVSTADYATPVVHWPFEDDSDATSAASAVPGGAPAVTSGFSFAADTTCVGAAPLAKQTATSFWSAPVPTYASTGTATAMFVSAVPTEPAAEICLCAFRTTATAAVWQVNLAPGAPSTLHIRAYSAAGVAMLDDSVSVTEADFYGIAYFYTLTLTQTGTGIDYTLTAYSDPGGFGKSGTLAANTAGNITAFFNTAQAGLANVSLGHVALHVQPGADGGFSNTAVISANSGDWPWSRVQRICAEQAIPVIFDQSDNFDLQMGPQQVASVMTLLRECETVEGCVLNDSGAFVGETGILWFPARDDRENLTAMLTLDVDASEVAPPFVPILDDQDVVNDVEVSRVDGSSARAEDEVSIEIEGRYREQVTVNTEGDADLADLAGWRLNLGTTPGMRFPSVSWNLRRSPTLAQEWMACGGNGSSTGPLFHRIDILNPPSQYPPDDIAAILEGYTETISAETWTVTANLSPYPPNHVATLATPTADAGEFIGRLAGDDNAAIRTTLTTTGTAIAFDPNRMRWTTVADDFDPDLQVRLAGEVVEVSSIATTAATFVAAGTVAHAVNASVTPALPAGVATNDLLLIFAAIRNSGAGIPVAPSGYTRLPVFGTSDNVQLFAKVHDGSESDPTVTFTGGVANADTTAQMAAFRNMPITLTDLADVVVRAQTSLNASAQDIAYPALWEMNQDGCVVLALGWKQDDWTSVAALSGFTEIGEPDTTTGDDQGIVWDYVIQTTAAYLNAGSFVVTGGASAISRGALVALAGGFQTMTASARSVNGVVKSHTVGTLAAVEDPGVMGM